MPRKTVGLPFEVHPSPMKDERGEKLLYAKPQSGMKIELKDIEAHYGDKYSIRPGELQRIFASFLEASARLMCKGYTIETPIGTFSAKLEMKRQVTNPDAVRHDDVKVAGIDFRPAHEYVEELESNTWKDGFRYVRKKSSAKLLDNQQFLLDVLTKSIGNKGYTTVSEFRQKSGLTAHSARKQLAYWSCGENAILKWSTVGNTTIYTQIRHIDCP